MSHDSLITVGLLVLSVVSGPISALSGFLGVGPEFLLTLLLLLVGAVGSYFGARLTSLYLPGARIKQIFGILLVVTTAYKIWTMLP